MSLSPHPVRRLRNTPVRTWIQALERDGFTYRQTQGSGRLYRHPDGQRVVIHYHRSSDTLPMGTLSNVLAGARWNEEDLIGWGFYSPASIFINPNPTVGGVFAVPVSRLSQYP